MKKAFLLLFLLTACTTQTVTVTNLQPLIIGNDTASIGGDLLTGGSCTNQSTYIYGATNNMTVIVTPQEYPGDGIVWGGYVSQQNYVMVKVCSIIDATPTSSVYHARVVP